MIKAPGMPLFFRRLNPLIERHDGFGRRTIMKMKRQAVLVSGIFFLCFCLFTPFLTASEAADKPIKMNFSGIMPGGHLQAALNQLFCDRIAERTNGRVQITLYPGSTLTAPSKNFEGVVKGISDLGMSCPLYTAGRFPVSEIFEMPSEIDSGWVTAKVYMDLFKKFKLKEYEDVHVLYLHGPGRNVISTRTVPIRKLADMKGVVMRASGGAASTIAALGATPRAMHMGEAYAALSKGVVEGQFAVPETLKGWKHADVVKYVSIPPVSTSSCQYVVINKRKWNSLPADIKKVFTEVSAEFPDYHGYVWNYYDQAGLEYFKSLPGRELIVIPKDQRPEWDAAVKPVIEKYIKEKTAKGLPAKEMLDYFNERITYWTAKKPSIEKCTQWVEQNLLKKKK
jgi:TRAP-type C4-dicarboxylate transport system substrate-binding protein